MRTLSIDPGINGAISVWEHTLESEELAYIMNMIYAGKVIDIDWLWSTFSVLQPKTIIVEAVHTAPRAGVVSSGNFMYTVGCIHTAAMAVGADLIKIPPKTWKNAVGLYNKPKSMALIVFEKELGSNAYDKNILHNRNGTDRAESALMGVAYFKLLGYGKI